MKCQEMSELLVAYLDGEVSPSERTLIQVHLAGCDACQEELAVLSALQSRVSQFLQVRAAQAAPSLQAWSSLQARLAREARPSLSWLPTWLQRLAPGVGRINQIFEGGITMKKGFAFATLVALMIAFGTVAFVPSVQAQVKELFRWFRFESPAGGEVSIIGSTEFTPLRPTYLPAGFQAMAIGLNPEAASLNYWNSTTNQILIIDQQRLSSAGTSLPPGMSVTVNGQPAVLITGLEGSVTFVSLPPTPSAPITPPADSEQVMPLEPITAPAEIVSYTDGRQLIWCAGDIRIEMFSNLPEEEMLKIAESMAPAETGEGEPPF